MPSPLKSARNGVSRETDAAGRPTGSKVPSPLPSSTPIALSWLLTVTRSGRPSPLTSATTVWTGERSVAKVCCVPKGSVAVVQQDAHAVAAVVGGDDVGLAVAGQVGHGHRIGPGADGEGLLRAGMCRCRCP